MSETTEYYNTHAESYYADTIGADMKYAYKRFQTAKMAWCAAARNRQGGTSRA